MLTIITPVLEITDQLKNTSDSVNKICLKHDAKWWIVSPYSTKNKLKKILFLKYRHISFFTERGPQIWSAYNTLINEVDDFYIPLSIGDTLIENDFDKVMKILSNKKNRDVYLMFFSVIKNNKIVKAKKTLKSFLATSGFASGHSAACIISKMAHQRFGEYDESFSLAADNHLFEKIYLESKDYICWFPDIILGNFIGGGMSTFNLNESFNEIYLSRTKAGRNIYLEKLIYFLRRIKYNV